MRSWDSLGELLAIIGDTCPSFDPPVTANSRRCDGDTPLHVAAIWGDTVAIEMLIRAGADVNAVGEMGFTPLHYVVLPGLVAAARCLLAAGASHLIYNEFGDTPHQKATRSGDPEMVGLFSGLSAEQNDYYRGAPRLPGP